MFVHPSGLTYSQASLSVCMAQPPVETSDCQGKKSSFENNVTQSLRCYNSGKLEVLIGSSSS
nr:unnamed protein product [Callosobruchus chinensis]